jgi:hypothetical protein
MKLNFQCSKCFIEYVTTKDFVQIQDDDLYEFECSNKHRNIYFVNNQKFELLMESAIYAIHDGYYREAISAMAASLERLQEFVIHIILRKNNFSESQFETSWKTVRKQSERQLGAFTFLYLQEFRELPDLLTDKERGFRNEVIHNGYFPNYNEALVFGQRVLDVTFNVLSKLRETSENVITSFKHEQSEIKLQMIIDRGENPFTHQMPNIINLNWHISSFKKANLLEYLKETEYREV